MRTIKSEEVVQ